MLRLLQKFLFLFKSKYRRKWKSGISLFYSHSTKSETQCRLQIVFLYCILINLLLMAQVNGVENLGLHRRNINYTSLSAGLSYDLSNCIPSSSVADSVLPDPSPCFGNGLCVNNTCRCSPGWSGKFCEYCSGKVK